jgi:hypothetical protein
MDHFRLLLTLSLTITVATLCGQSQPKNANTQTAWGNNILRTFDLAERGMEGPMHLLDENTTATVVWKVGGDSSVTESGNYHLYLDQFVFVEDEKEKSVDYERIKLFRFEQPGLDSEFIHASLLSDQPFEGKTSFLQKVYYDENETTSVWKYWFINEVPPNYNEAMNTGSKNTMLKRRSQYVLLKDGEWYMNFKLKKGTFKEVFPEKAADLAKYVKSNKLDDSPESFSQFASYVNSGE